MPRAVNAPTAKQLSLLRYILQFIQDYGYQPSRAEMAVHFRVTKTCINTRLRQLENHGFLELRHLDRAIKIHDVHFRAFIVQSGALSADAATTS